MAGGWSPAGPRETASSPAHLSGRGTDWKRPGSPPNLALKAQPSSEISTTLQPHRAASGTT
eukprot:3820961-Pyramimonas_sp.AAC.1